MTWLEVESVVRATTSALDGGNAQGLRPHLDATSLLHVPGETGLAGDYQGTDAICSLLDRMVDVSGGTLRFETLRSTQHAGGQVRLEGRIEGRRLQRSLSQAASVRATLADGSIREAWLDCSDQSAWDAFWT